MKLAMTGLVALAIVGSAAAAQASDFYATPMNSGAPTNLPGETLIPGMSLAMQGVNAVTQPILQPILAPGGDAAAAPAPAPMMKKHHMMHHHKMMMHKKMMKKSM